MSPAQAIDERFAFGPYEASLRHDRRGPTAAVVRAGLPEAEEIGVRDCPYSKDEPFPLDSCPREG